MRDLVPAPLIAKPWPDQDLRLTRSTRILARGQTAAVGEYLAEVLRPATGLPLPVVDGGPAEDAIVLRLPSDPIGEQYRLTVVPSGVRLAAGTPAGLAAGVQTLRHRHDAGPCHVPAQGSDERGRDQHRPVPRCRPQAGVDLSGGVRKGDLAAVRSVESAVARHGKTAVSWHELLGAAPARPVVAQYRGRTDEDPLVSDAMAKGHRVLLSPSTRAYLDMKYTTETPFGFKWAAYIDVADAYGWDPGTFLRGVPAEAVLGVEAPLWTETVERFDQVEYMAFPRLAAIAELGWSPPSTHDWSDFARRLATHGPRLAATRVNFYRSAQIDWL